MRSKEPTENNLQGVKNKIKKSSSMHKNKLIRVGGEKNTNNTDPTAVKRKSKSEEKFKD